MNFIEKDGNYRLLEEFKKNGRTLIVWWNEAEKTANLVLFADEPKNELSKRCAKHEWGYVTKMKNFGEKSTNLEYVSKAVEVYIHDINKGNYWWEKDKKQKLSKTEPNKLH